MGGKLGAIPVGTKVNRLEVIATAEKIGKYPASLVKCSCGTVKVMMNHNLRGGLVHSCGCYHSERASEQMKENPPRLVHGGASRKVGNEKHRLTYLTWMGMFSRCYDERNTSYKNYGAKGVVICDRWKDRVTGFPAFVEDMGLRPSTKHSIDRIKKGNYEPGNCRWATREEQNRNVGLKKSNTSGYKGLTWCKGKWRAEIRVNRKHVGLGCYVTKEEAAYAYNLGSRAFHGEFGVRNKIPKLLPEVKEQVRSVVLRLVRKAQEGV